MIPLKLELDANNVSVTWCYPFLRYGSANETYIVVNDKTYEAVYSTAKKAMQEYPVASSWFTVDNLGNITLKNNYIAETTNILKIEGL